MNPQDQRPRTAAPPRFGVEEEFLVVDPFWPKRPGIIQPRNGGVSRARFWIPAHAVFEVLLIVTLVVAWGDVDVRVALLVALVSHAVMRVWSLVNFVPKALAFEKAPALPIFMPRLIPSGW